MGMCEMPYDGMALGEAWAFIIGGGRLHKPPHTPDFLYEVMLHCWKGKEEDRPMFNYIHAKLFTFCASESGYREEYWARNRQGGDDRKLLESIERAQRELNAIEA